MEIANSLTGYNCCLRIVLGDVDYDIKETNESHYNRHVVIVLEGGKVIVKLFGSPYEIHQIYTRLLPLFNNKSKRE